MMRRRCRSDMISAMPQIRIQAPGGDSTSITSSDPATISRWLLEWVYRLGSDRVYGPQLCLEVWPLAVPDGKGGVTSDWPDPDRITARHMTPAEVAEVAGFLAQLDARRRAGVAA